MIELCMVGALVLGMGVLVMLIAKALGTISLSWPMTLLVASVAAGAAWLLLLLAHQISAAV